MPFTGYGPNDYIVEGCVARIVLCDRENKPTGFEAIVDTDDLKRVIGYGRWRLDGAVVSSLGSEITGPRVMLHKFITESPKHEKVFHLDGNRLDCRKSNLFAKGPRSAVVENGVATVEVTDKNGDFLGFFTIDEEDLPRVCLLGRCFIGTAGYVYVHPREGSSRRVSLHRFLVDAPKGSVVDHINRNPSDNRKSNLRIVTHAENLQNQSLDGAGRSGKKNVVWCCETQKWMVRIIVNGKIHVSRRYAELGDAMAEAARMRRELHTCSPEDSFLL